MTKYLNWHIGKIIKLKPGQIGANHYSQIVQLV